jgi:hypothetical protein
MNSAQNMDASASRPNLGFPQEVTGIPHQNYDATKGKPDRPFFTF